jgi:hypothetical protein
MVLWKKTSRPSPIIDTLTLPPDQRAEYPVRNDEQARWLSLADLFLCRVPTEEDITEVETLARAEQERIKRHVRPAAEKFKRQSKSKH